MSKLFFKFHGRTTELRKYLGGNLPFNVESFNIQAEQFCAEIQHAEQGFPDSDTLNVGSNRNGIYLWYCLRVNAAIDTRAEIDAAHAATAKKLIAAGWKESKS